MNLFKKKCAFRQTFEALEGFLHNCVVFISVLTEKKKNYIYF